MATGLEMNTYYTKRRKACKRTQQPRISISMSRVYYAHVFVINEIIRNAVRTVYPDMPNTEVMQYSTHSVRVWACVSLDEAGKSPDFIQRRLRWLVKSYRVYLKDTKKSTSNIIERTRQPRVSFSMSHVYCAHVFAINEII